MSRIVETAQVAPEASIGQDCSIWDYAQIREGAALGDNCIIGRGAYIDAGVTLGDNCKVQNYALVYEPARLADGVFIGPAAVLTNDHWPRAINPDGTLKTAADWDAVGVTVGRGAAIGARAVCVAPVTIGAWATVAAGAVVTADVPDYALMVGVPARRVGWVGRAGLRLVERSAHEALAADAGQSPHEAVTYWECPATGETYTQHGETLVLDSQ